MKKNTGPVLPEHFYHIYNRGIDGETLFKLPRNYPYFLQQYGKYITPIADTYAYALMGNHFHLLVRIKTEAEIREQLAAGALGVQNKAKAAQKTIEQIINNQFAKLFNSYAQSINNQEKLGVGGKRTGGLFEESFRRIPILTQDYLMRMVYYCHFNPQKHGFVC
jgi:putative transposase